MVGEGTVTREECNCPEETSGKEGPLGGPTS